MIKTIVLVVLSFFAVIGFIETLLTFLETVSTFKYKNISSVKLVAEIEGNVENPVFLLNTLLLQAERICYGDLQTKVVIKDMGIDENTYSQIYGFCLENDNISVEK